ncbi:unnamed protein product [Soboliphyme baturini]|uniref:BPI2 domain-containing protein n=1 Tax=Soboliphyme baturini TaxID=241478 RepID=A0A183J2H3_9BILA|nr:unnamed protein product [Soboliphyme baturini]
MVFRMKAKKEAMFLSSVIIWFLALLLANGGGVQGQPAAFGVPYGSMPGAVIRITHRGLNALMAKIGQIITQIIPQIRIPFVTSGTAAFGIEYSVKDVVIIRATPPRQFQILLQPGAASQIVLVNLSFRLGLHFYMSPQGGIGVKVAECLMNCDNIDVAIEEISGMSLLRGIIKNVVRRKLDKFVQEEACQAVGTIGVDEVTKWMSQTLTRFRLFDKLFPSKHQASRTKRSSYKQFDPNNAFMDLLQMATKLVLDFSVVGNPTVRASGYSMYFEIPVKGEVTLEGSSPYTPIRAQPIPSKNENFGKMIYIIVTDYTFNTLLYQMYSHKMLNLVLTKKSIADPEVRSFLYTKCQDNECIGAALPELQKYPMQAMVVYVTALAAPKAVIIDGAVRMSAKIRLTGYASYNNKKVKAFSYDFNSVGDLKLTCRQGTITSTFTMQSVTSLDKNKPLPPKLIQLIKRGMQQEMSGLLGSDSGFKIPHIGIGQLSRIEMKTKPNALSLSSDFAVNQQLLYRMISNVIHRKLGSTGGMPGPGMGIPPGF